MAIRIRPGTLNDCSAIAKVHVDSWRTTYNSIVPNEYVINMSYSDSEKRWIKRLQHINTNCMLRKMSSGQLLDSQVEDVNVLANPVTTVNCTLYIC